MQTKSVTSAQTSVTEHSEETSASYRKPDWVIRMEELKHSIQGMNESITLVSPKFLREANTSFCSSSVSCDFVDKPISTVLAAPAELTAPRLVALSSRAHLSLNSDSTLLNGSREDFSSLPKVMSESTPVKGEDDFNNTNAASYLTSESSTLTLDSDESNTIGSSSNLSENASSSYSIGNLSIGSDSVFSSEPENNCDMMSTSEGRSDFSVSTRSSYSSYSSESTEMSNESIDKNPARSILTEYLSSHRTSISQFLETLCSGDLDYTGKNEKKLGNMYSFMTSEASEEESRTTIHDVSKSHTLWLDNSCSDVNKTETIDGREVSESTSYSTKTMDAEGKTIQPVSRKIVVTQESSDDNLTSSSTDSKKNSKIPIMKLDLNTRRMPDGATSQENSPKVTTPVARRRLKLPSPTIEKKNMPERKPIWGSPLNRTLSSKKAAPVSRSNPGTPVTERKTFGRSSSVAGHDDRSEHPSRKFMNNKSISCNSYVLGRDSRAAKPTPLTRTNLKMSGLSSSVPSSPKPTRTTSTRKSRAMIEVEQKPEVKHAYLKRSVSRDTTATFSRYHPRNVSENNKRGVSTDSTKSISGDNKKTVSRENSRSISGDLKRSVSRDTTKSVSRDKSSGVSRDSTARLSRDSNSSVSRNTRRSVSRDTKRSVSGDNKRIYKSDVSIELKASSKPTFIESSSINRFRRADSLEDFMSLEGDCMTGRK